MKGGALSLGFTFPGCFFFFAFRVSPFFPLHFSLSFDCLSSLSHTLSALQESRNRDFLLGFSHHQPTKPRSSSKSAPSQTGRYPYAHSCLAHCDKSLFTITAFTPVSPPSLPLHKDNRLPPTCCGPTLIRLVHAVSRALRHCLLRLHLLKTSIILHSQSLS